MITPAYSTTATERVVPRLNLNFTTGVLDPRITLTRALNTATCFNSSGLIAVVNADLPRFDYNPVTLALRGLLIEEQRTNLATFSEQFDDAVWVKSGSSITANSGVSPDGTLTADRLVEDTSTGDHRVFRSVALGGTVDGSAYAISVFAKASGRSRIRMIDNNQNTSGVSFFDLATGTVVSGTGQITPVGNGWYRCTIFPLKNFSTTSTLIINLVSSGTTFSYTGDGTSGVFLWGAQIEAGAFATSYIPTTTTALTRNADVATMTGTNFSGWWTATAGSANVSIIPKSAIGTKPLFQMDDGTADNIISLRGNVANPELYIKSTTDQVQLDAGTIVANTAYKLASAWNTNSCAAAQNGAAAVTDTSATIPTVTQARIGSDGTNYANGWLQKINYWPQRITDNETQAFSK